MYTYSQLKSDISRYGYNAVSIGKSVKGRNIYAIKAGEGGNTFFITGGIHARENVTCVLVMKQLAGLTGRTDDTFYFLPMLNPDGAEICAFGSDDSFLLRVNGGADFSMWKANANAVDLNVNFDAKYGKGKYNLTYPAPQNYIGEYAFSEPETAALAKFTLQKRPCFTVSYHCAGREIYWQFSDADQRLKKMAYSIGRRLNYDVVDGENGSVGGYKDWCILNGIPAVTIEIGLPPHPLTEVDAAEDIERNSDLPLFITEKYHEFYERGNKGSKKSGA